PKPGALAKLSHTPKVFFVVFRTLLPGDKVYYTSTLKKSQHFFSIFFIFFALILKPLINQGV
ncbi:MAG: hypothetical protein U0M58_09960, partial [Blautia sp.]|nr:hypothetical protein [Blautia sp.]